SITVTAINTNQPPMADAGPDQQANGNDIVVVSGANSTDPEGSSLSYTWQQVSGPVVTVLDSEQAQASFIAPENGGEIELSLTVNDGELNSVSDSIIISVQAISTALVAHAGADQTVRSNTLVSLDASESTHSEHLSLSYAWRQTGGP
ncbi:hypothetical protein, partial [Oleiphilus sp. HI0132]